MSIFSRGFNEVVRAIVLQIPGGAALIMFWGVLCQVVIWIFTNSSRANGWFTGLMAEISSSGVAADLPEVGFDGHTLGGLLDFCNSFVPLQESLEYTVALIAAGAFAVLVRFVLQFIP